MTSALVASWDSGASKAMVVISMLEPTSNVIEDYLEDKYGPSCLILGFTSAGRPLHVQCSYPTRPLVKIVTVYEPDPDLWIDLKTRKID